MKKRYFAFFMSGIMAACFSLLTACSAPSRDDPAVTEIPATGTPTDAVSPTLNVPSGITATPTEAPKTQERKLLTGSFLQEWLCIHWTYERWYAEFEAMKELGMDTLILQSVYDMNFDQGGGNVQDWEACRSTDRYGLYPSAIEELEGLRLSPVNNGDALEYALQAAKESGMKVFIGLLADNRWWNYGWGIPKLPTGKTDIATESYFASWCEYNGRLNAEMAGEIWNRYGAEYGEQIAGWYYYNEIWNIDAGCAQTDDKVYARCIGNNINLLLDAINSLCPEKPLMLSPFYNPDLSSAEQYRAFWTDIFSVADFRPGDIFAPQDCVGAKNVPIEDLAEWIGSLKAAAKTEEEMRFWVNNENFNEDLTPADVSRFTGQIEATEPYAETHIMFSWNHYYDPLNDSSAAAYNDALKEYLNKKSDQ